MKGLRSLLLAALLAGGCEEKLKPAVVDLPGSELPSQESWNSTVVFSDSARRKAVLSAGHIAVYRTRMETVLEESVAVDFYDESERRTSRLTARRGRVDDRTRDFEASGRVVVVSDSGTVLRTERLFWDNAARRIHTDAFVEITTPSEIIQGHGMESDQALRHYRIFRVTGQTVVRE
ncbi:MAG: LPS export ABC transporter periplasmic protein LptC [Bacteroidota bacterium]